MRGCHDNSDSSHSSWMKTVSIDPSSSVFYRWLVIISLAVVYNVVVIIARAVFWKLHDQYIYWWLVTDYVADLI